MQGTKVQGAVKVVSDVMWESQHSPAGGGGGEAGGGGGVGHRGQREVRGHGQHVLQVPPTPLDSPTHHLTLKAEWDQEPGTPGFPVSAPSFQGIPGF